MTAVDYYISKRYSDLLTFHQLLKTEIKDYQKRKNISGVDFPEFPPKKLLFNKEPQFIMKRIHMINDYFAQVFKVYPNKLPYTNAVIDLCLPFKLNVALIGKKNCGKTNYIEAIINVLTQKRLLTPPHEKEIPLAQEPIFTGLSNNDT